MSVEDGLTDYARSLDPLGHARLAVQEYSCNYDEHAANIDRLILEVQAAMPCEFAALLHKTCPQRYDERLLPVSVAATRFCISCTASAKLAQKTTRIVDPTTFYAEIGPEGILSAEERI